MIAHVKARSGPKPALYELDGQTFTLRGWCAQRGLLVATVKGRLRKGLSLREALAAPLQDMPHPSARLYEMDGESLPLRAWCDRFHIAYATVYKRLRAGWTLRADLAATCVRKGGWHSPKTPEHVKRGEPA